VNDDGIFVLDTIDTFSNGSSYIFDVITDSTGFNKFQGYNVDWKVPQISGLLGLDWRIARFFSFQSELGLSVIDKHLFFRLLAGPAFHLHSDKIGGRIGVCLGLMKYSYNLVYLAKEFSLGESSFTPHGDFWLFTEKMDDAFAPYLDAYATINTMQEFVGMNYFANIGYERMNYYVERELYGDDLKVRFSFFSLQVGVFKQIGNWTVTGSGGYKFENRWHINTDTLSRSYKVNASDKAVIPLFTISVGYTFGEKQNAALRRKK